MLYAGVDLGTSSVKLLLMDEKGNIQKIVSRDYPLYFPEDGYSEIAKRPYPLMPLTPGHLVRPY